MVDNDILIDESGYCIQLSNGDILIMPQGPVVTYNINTNLTNVSGRSTNQTTIEAGGIATLFFDANSGYKLPDEITVTGAAYVYDKTTNSVALSNPPGKCTSIKMFNRF